jgi:hypothetical protein
MADARDWDKELARVDRQLGSMSDAELLAAAGAERVTVPASPVGRDPVVAPVKTARATGKWGVYFRVALSLILGVGLLFWPYDTRCGPGLFGYLLGAGMTSVTGGWAGIFSWKARMPAVHVLSLALFIWGLVLGAAEILPRTGYAVPSEAHPAQWFCQ